MSFFKKSIYWLMYNEGMDPLPHKTIFVLTAQYFLEAMTSTTVFSYLPQLVKSFGASEEQAGRNAGWIASSLFIARICSGLFWGYLMDKIDPKKVIVISSICLIISTFLFGFSCSFYWALVTRFMQGAFSASGLASKAIVTHQSNDTNIALAFSILFTSYSLGVIIGPSFAGFLVFLAEQYPKRFKKDGFFGRKLDVDSVFVVYEENMDCLKESEYCNISFEKDDCHQSSLNLSEGSKLINSTKNGCFDRAKKNMITSKFIQVLMNKDCLFSMILYGMFCIVGIGRVELFTIYAATSKEFEGLAMSTSQIGLILMSCSIIDIIGTITLSPKILQKFGAKTSFICWIIIFGCTSPFLPIFTKIANRALQWFVLVTWNGVIEIVSSGCFLSVNLFISNSVMPDLQGTVTGLGMSMSSIGRAIGPVCFGNAFSWSLSNMKSKSLGFPFNQYFAFFLVSVVCFTCAVFTHLIISNSLNKKRVPMIKKNVIVRVSHYLYTC